MVSDGRGRGFFFELSEVRVCRRVPRRIDEALGLLRPAWRLLPALLAGVFDDPGNEGVPTACPRQRWPIGDERVELVVRSSVQIISQIDHAPKRTLFSLFKRAIWVPQTADELPAVCHRAEGRLVDQSNLEGEPPPLNDALEKVDAGAPPARLDRRNGRLWDARHTGELVLGQAPATPGLP